MDWFRKVQVLSSIFIILTHFITTVTSMTICINNGNFTQGSTYGSNLNTVLSSLPTNVNDTGFYYTSFALNQDTANAFVMCRADVSLGTCKNCTQAAISETQSSCPTQKQGFDWQDDCMLRYSNDSLYGKLETSYGFYLWNRNNASSAVQFKEDLQNLLNDLFNKAPNGGDSVKVAAGNVSGPDFQTIFAMVQCKPDLRPEDCSTCLYDARNEIPVRCDGKIGCRVLLESCFLRFEIVPFYNETRIQEVTMNVADMNAPSPQIMSPPLSPPGNKKRTIVLIASLIAGLVILVITGWSIFRKRTKHQRSMETIDNGDEISTVESLQYDFEKIRSATNDFSDENKLGEGGFGAVHKGKLQNGQEIAVKRLSKNSGQGDLEFKKEVLLLSRLQHRNLVRLLGFSLEGEEKLLVYEFVQNASLDQFIFDPVKKSQLDWDSRSKIIGGIARGLLYLHEDSRLRIIHRDLKASNVLLDGEMNPKIADFGMARLFARDDQTQGSTSRIVGTYGYMAPEYAMHGHFSMKSDVFSFGVLLLEIVSGQKNNCFQTHNSIHDLSSYAWKNWQEGTSANIIEPILKSASGSIREMLRCIHIGLLCVQENVADRPTMASVVLMLSSLSLTLASPSEPAFFVEGDGMEETDNNTISSESDQKKLIDTCHSAKSMQSKNEASITDLYPRNLVASEMDTDNMKESDQKNDTSSDVQE